MAAAQEQASRSLGVTPIFDEGLPHHAERKLIDATRTESHLAIAATNNFCPGPRGNSPQIGSCQNLLGDLHTSVVFLPDGHGYKSAYWPAR